MRSSPQNTCRRHVTVYYRQNRRSHYIGTRWPHIARVSNSMQFAVSMRCQDASLDRLHWFAERQVSRGLVLIHVGSMLSTKIRRNRREMCDKNVQSFLCFSVFVSLLVCFCKCMQIASHVIMPTKLHCSSLEKSDVGKRPTLLESRNEKRESWVSWIAKTPKTKIKKVNH